MYKLLYASHGNAFSRPQEYPKSYWFALFQESSEIHRLRWSDVMYSEGLLTVRAKLKRGKVRYVPCRRSWPQKFGDILRSSVKIGSSRQTRGQEREAATRGSFDDLLVRAKIQNFWFHDLRHTFASWYMMNAGDLYELAKILGHSNIKMTERCQAGTQARHKDQQYRKSDLDSNEEEAGAGAGRGRPKTLRIVRWSCIGRATKTATLWSLLSY
jgi:integrase